MSADQSFLCAAMWAMAANVAVSVVAHGEISHGAHQFGSESHCLASGKLSADICSNADANAAAEFEEKAPRFSTRIACERVFPAGCSLGFRGAAGYAGQRAGLFFSPRQQGFRVTVKSEHEVTVTPLGPGAAYGARSALRRDASIHPHGSRAYVAPTGARREAAGFGLATPEGPKGGALPPRPSVDPNFDCSSVLEPGADPTAACVLAPARRR